MSDLIAVTGASGFLGRFLVPVLLQRGFRVRVWTRSATTQFPLDVERMVGDLRDSRNTDNLVSGADVVVHLAGRAHLPDHTALQRQELFEVNLGLTSQLARSAAEHGVRRFVFASTIGVLGSCSPEGQALTEASAAHPDGNYARSKLAAEQQLLALADRGSLEVTIVRPTLVFGPGAPGNVQRLVRLVASGLPLPLGKLDNRRSFIGARNLADLFGICCVHPLAGGQLFVAADDVALSLPEIMEILGHGLRRRVRIWPLPRPLLAVGARLLGKSADLTKIAAPLVVDASRARTVLGWCSSQTLSDAIHETAACFAANRMR
jgi:nucleoside-diphosphate-sugar epimerase